MPAPGGETLLIRALCRTVTPTLARYFSAFSAREVRNAGRISDPAVTTVMLTLGCAGAELNHPARPLRYSPSSPAVSTPAGPPPPMTMVLA